MFVGAIGGGRGGGGEGGTVSLLSSDFSGLELGDKLLDGLVLEVRAHVAGEGPVRMALLFSTADAKIQD